MQAAEVDDGGARVSSVHGKMIKFRDYFSDGETCSSGRALSDSLNTCLLFESGHFFFLIRKRWCDPSLLCEQRFYCGGQRLQ